MVDDDDDDDDDDEKGSSRLCGPSTGVLRTYERERVNLASLVGEDVMASPTFKGRQVKIRGLGLARISGWKKWARRESARRSASGTGGRRGKG